MARTLKRTVVVGGVTYAAGTEETAKLAKAIPNEKAWDGEPAPARRSSRGSSSSSGGSGSGGGSQSPAAEPPRGGEGATEEAWRAYATELGVEVPEDAGRDDIIALVDARNS